MWLRSPRRISTSPPAKSAGRLAFGFPLLSIKTHFFGLVFRLRISSRRPIRRSTVRCTGPRKSTGLPPSRSAGARSTTVGLKPKRRSQKASAGPATLAPEMRTFLLFVMVLRLSGAAYRTPTVG
jgi:hypothetical protein